MNHDSRFKSLLKLFFREFLELFFPEFARRIDWKHPLEFLDKELEELFGASTDERVDVLIKAWTRPDEAGGVESLYCLVHIEVESRRSRPELGQRMFDYFGPIFKRHRLPIMPVALYLNVGGEGIGWQDFQVVCFDELVLQLRFPYIGLPALDGVGYAGMNNPMGWALAGLMRISASEKARIKLESLQRVERRKMAQSRKRLLLEFVDAYQPLDADQQQSFDRMIQLEPFREVKEMYESVFDVMERQVTERVTERVTEQVTEQVTEKVTEQARQSVLHLIEAFLRQKFGTVSQRAGRRLEKMTLDELLEFHGKALTAATKKDLGI